MTSRAPSAPSVPQVESISRTFYAKIPTQQRQQGSDHQRDDEADLGDTNILVSSPASLGVNQGVCSSLNGKNGVGVDGDLLSQLSGVDLRFILGLSLLPPVGVVPGTVLGLALAEAHSDVALEPDVVAGWELEGIEGGSEDAKIPFICPLPEDGGVSGTAIVVSNLDDRQVRPEYI